MKCNFAALMGAAFTSIHRASIKSCCAEDAAAFLTKNIATESASGERSRPIFEIIPLLCPEENCRHFALANRGAPIAMDSRQFPYDQRPPAFCPVLALGLLNRSHDAQGHERIITQARKRALEMAHDDIGKVTFEVVQATDMTETSETVKFLIPINYRFVPALNQFGWRLKTCKFISHCSHWLR